MPALLPFEFDPVQVPVIPHPYAMSPLTSGYQFSGIAEKMRGQLPRTLVRSDHSIPHIGAYVEYMRSEILHGSVSRYVTRWHGILAMIGLSRLYGFSLSVRDIDLSSTPATVQGRVSSGPVYKKEMERLGLMDTSHYYMVVRTIETTSGKVSLPLAMLDPHVLIVPFKSIDPRAVADVPWYDSAADCWYEIDENYMAADADTKARLLTEYCQLACWLDVQAGAAGTVGAVGLMNQLRNWSSGLLHGAQLPALNTTYTLPNTPPSVFTGSALSISSFCSVPDLEVPLVPQFTRRLMLTNARTLSTTTRWNCTVKGEFDVLTVVPPLTPEFAALLDEHVGDGRLRLLDIRVDDQFIANGCIGVELIFSDGLLKMSRSRWYTADQIVFAENFPYLSMWPYVNLAPHVWNQYYVYMVHQNGLSVAPGNCDSVDAASSLSFCGGKGVKLSEIRPKDVPGTVIPLRFSSCFPRFVSLQYVDKLGQTWECGCLISEPGSAEVQINPGLIAKACIDFGTSNSVCAVEAGNKIHKVLNGDRVRALVELSGARDDVASDFHRYHGVSTNSRDYKFPSVAQLYVGLNDDPISDGKIMLAESGIINYFSQKSVAITKAQTNLAQVGIFTELKTDDAQPLADVNRAAQVFIKHLMLLCSLEARCMQANGVEFYFSYPNEQYLKNLSPLWSAAAAYIDGLKIFPSEVQCGRLTERMAASHFVRVLMPDNTKSAAPVPGFAVVDIGGGTSDMTVWRRPFSADDPIFRGDAALYNDFCKAAAKSKELPTVQGANLSFRYAGNQLFGRTFYTYFKKNPTMLSLIFPQIFGLSADANGVRMPASVGNYAADVAARLVPEAVNNYMNTLPKVPSYKDPGFPALTALLNSLLENPGINVAFWNTPKCAELRNILSFKLKGILYVLGLLVGECAGIHPDNKAGVFNIYLVGGGSQAYRYVIRNTFDEATFSMLAQLPGLLFGAYSDTDALKRRFQLMPPADGNKVEVVDGMLEYENAFAGSPGSILTPRLPDNEWSKVGTPITSELMSELSNSYRTFIDFAVKQDSTLEKLLPVLELVEEQEERDEQQNRVFNHYMATYQNIWSEVNSGLDSNVSTVIREAVFDVMMAEELLS